MKFTYAALAAVAAAEQMYGFVSEFDNGAFPAVTTPLTFVQSVGQENFQILMEPQPTQSKSPSLSSSASSSEPRSTTRNSTKTPQLPTQELSGPAASPSQSHPLPQAPSTISRSTVLMPMATPSSPCSPPSTSLDSAFLAAARLS